MPFYLYKLRRRVYLLVLGPGPRFVVQVTSLSNLINDSVVDFLVNEVLFTFRGLHLECVLLSGNLLRAILIFLN